MTRPPLPAAPVSRMALIAPIALVALVASVGTGPPARADGSVFHAAIPPQEGETFLRAEYSLWWPKEAERLRAVIVHQHGCGRNGIGVPYDVQWRALAERWDAALMGSHYEVAEDDCRGWCDPSGGTERAFLEALDRLSRTSAHPELGRVPRVLWGHSGGATWVREMAGRHPSRVVALFPRSLPGSDRDIATLARIATAVPVLLSLGAREAEDRFAAIHAHDLEAFRRVRAGGGRIALAIDPKASHDCRNSRYLAIPFFDRCLRQRLPPADDPAGELRAMDESRVWLGDPETKEIAPADSYGGERDRAVWLPDREIAAVWREFVRTGTVTDRTRPETPPYDLRTARTPGGDISISWKAKADLESGIAEFRVYRDGRRIATVAGPRLRDGTRPFDAFNYGDEPSAPRPVMRYLDHDAGRGVRRVYRISTVNRAGLESDRSEPVTVPPAAAGARDPG